MSDTETAAPAKPEFFETHGSKPLQNPRLEAFLQNLIAGMDKPQAYLAAGFKCKNRDVARICANQALRETPTFNRYQFLQGRKADYTAAEAGISRAWVLQMLKENAEAAMGRVELDETTGKIIGIHGYEGAVANAALKLLGQEAGAMFKERLEHTGQDGRPIEIRARVTVYIPSNGRDAPPG